MNILGDARKAALEAAAKAYSDAKPLHWLWGKTGNKPVLWEKLKDSDDEVRQDTVRQHRIAIKAAIDAYEKLAR
jgi:hypothetical protein